ncbi:MAG: hypothetical protein IPN13_15215 [Bacteroidetes bacterium]|nr:hypothetical protein [Bacteroidota bacterium]
MELLFGQSNWVRRLQSVNVASMDFDLNYNLIVAGEFFGSTDINFDAGVLTFNVIAGAFCDTYIMEVSAAGAFTWAKQLRTTSSLATVIDENYPESVAVDDLDNIIITGWLNGSMDLDPGLQRSPLMPIQMMVYTLPKYSNVGNYVWGGVVVGASVGL